MITPSPSSYNLQTLIPEATKPRSDVKTPLPLFQLCKLLLICISWYCSSAISSIALKKCLTVFPFPLTLTLVQFVGCAVLSFPLLKTMRVRGGTTISKGLFMTGIFPLSFGKVVAVLFATVSIGNIPVSYSNTIKASLPIFSVFFARVILGQRHSKLIYLSLLIIISGVVICSFTELLFDLAGLLSALLSTMSTALLSVFAKKSMLDNNMHYLVMLYYMSLSSLALTTPLWTLLDASHLITLDWGQFENPMSEILPYFITVAVCNFMQNVAAFAFLSLVSPVSYSVANCMKRVFTIGLSLVVLQNPVTMTNMLGMGAAIGGVALYNKVKYEENKLAKLTLPTITKPNTTLPNHKLGYGNGVINKGYKNSNQSTHLYITGDRISSYNRNGGTFVT